MKILPLAAAVIMLTIQQGNAKTALPRLQPAQPVFESAVVRNPSPVCNVYAGYGATIQRTIQGGILDPLRSAAKDLARLFRPLFSDAQFDERRYRDPVAVSKLKQKTPSDMVRAAGQKRLCE